MNRTGLSAAPKDLVAQLMQVPGMTKPSARVTRPTPPPPRALYAKEGGEPVGTLPLPQRAGALALGKKAAVLLDKLGERLAFERSGTRLYEGVLVKFDAYGTWTGGPTRRELEKIHAEEYGHFTMLAEAIEALGGDPTAVTPAADVHAVASEGICKVVVDPRTTLQQTLEAMLVAELADNDCWTNLSALATQAGQTALATACEEATAHEREHLVLLRRWVAASLGVPALAGDVAPRKAAAVAATKRGVKARPVQRAAAKLSRAKQSRKNKKR